MLVVVNWGLDLCSVCHSVMSCEPIGLRLILLLSCMLVYYLRHLLITRPSAYIRTTGMGPYYG